MELDRVALLAVDDVETRRRFDQAVATARSFRPAPRPRTDLPRVVVTAFGKFSPHARNATAEIACALLDRSASFSTADDPLEHFRWLSGAIDLPRAGRIELHVVVLPVVWDLAAVLALRVIDAVTPDVIMMNGVHAGASLLVEVETNNLAAVRADASGFRPRSAKDPTPIVEGATGDLDIEYLTEEAVHAADAVLDRHAGRSAIHAVVTHAEAKPTNTFLCNQLAFLVHRAHRQDHRTLRLLRASEEDEGVDVHLERANPYAPRGFFHWPSTLAAEHAALCRDITHTLLDELIMESRK